MIIKALADYYERMLADASVDIAPFGWFEGRLDYVVKINGSGGFVSLNSLKRQDGKRLVGRPILLPCIGKQALKQTNSGRDANLLWDNSSFVFGLGNKGGLKLESFISAIRENLADLNDDAVNAILKYLEAGKADKACFASVVEHSEHGTEISEGRANISFSLEGDCCLLITERENLKSRISQLEFTDGVPFGICSVSGKQNQPIELCHSVIKNMYNVQKDPILVSFNKPAFNSFRKEQSNNSPVSQRAAFAYTTALNTLLKQGSHQRMQVGDASTVFWAKEPDALEDDFSFFLGEPPKGEESVSFAKIRSLLSAVKTGIKPDEEDIPFYVLGLAPNAARISIRFWYEGSVGEIKERIAQHFEDIEMVRAKYDREYLSLFQLLLATATQGKADNIPPNLGGDLVRSVLSGSLYPRTLLANAIRRCKAEQRVTHAQAAIIKGVLTRDARFNKITKEVDVALDKTNGNEGYVLGRLFAALERIQEQAQSGLNKTIRDTYFGAACSSPLVTFTRLQSLAIHHLAKIRNSGKSTVWLEQLMQEIVGLLSAEGISPILSLEDQGRFSIGYYHQRQSFFTKKETEDKGEEA